MKGNAFYCLLLVLPLAGFVNGRVLAETNATILSNSTRMTARFPLGCKKRYTAPYTVMPFNNSASSLCVKLQRANCGSDAKCKIVQSSIRKFMFSTTQLPLCGAKQLYKDGPYSGAARSYTAIVYDPKKIPVGGVSIVYFWHTYLNKTETATDVVINWASGVPQNMHDSVLCIMGSPVRSCLLNSKKQMLLSSFDVTDHSCDSGSLVQF